MEDGSNHTLSVTIDSSGNIADILYDDEPVLDESEVPVTGTIGPLALVQAEDIFGIQFTDDSGGGIYHYGKGDYILFGTGDSGFDALGMLQRGADALPAYDEGDIWGNWSGSGFIQYATTGVDYTATVETNLAYAGTVTPPAGATVADIVPFAGDLDPAMFDSTYGSYAGSVTYMWGFGSITNNILLFLSPDGGTVGGYIIDPDDTLYPAGAFILPEFTPLPIR